MRTAKFILPALLISLNFIACRKDGPWKVWGKGDAVTEVRNVKGFSGIDLCMSADLYYLQDSIYWVEVSAQSNVLPVIETGVYGNVLKIKTKALLFRNKPITITVHSPDIYLLSLSGSGNIYAQNALTANSLDVSVSGSGNIVIPSLSAKNVNGKISGSGNIKISGGEVSDEELRISGSGDMDALNLVSNTCRVHISGSGNMMVNVLQTLKITTSGSGDVKYKGTPAIETHMSGSGNIIHIN
jgi:Putative auto-transporter adhesin, head GIN domain